MSLDIAVSGISIIKGSPKIDQDSFKSELCIFDKGPYELNRVQKITAVAFIKVLADAGIAIDKINRKRIAIFLGNAYSIEEFKADFSKVYKNTSPNLVSPSLFPFTSSNSIASWLSMQFCIEGINLTFTNGCVSGSQAILAGCDSLVSGIADVAIIGGLSLICENLQEEFCVCGFQQELAGFVLLERKQSVVDAGRKPRFSIEDFHEGFLSDAEIGMLSNRQIPAKLENYYRHFGYGDKRCVLVHLGNSLRERRFAHASEIRENSSDQQIMFLNDKAGNAFSAAGILGLSCVNKDNLVFFDTDSYGAYIGLSVYAGN